MQGVKKGHSYADGGMIRGPGTGTSDSIKKKVRPGSYIMPADSTRKAGGFNLARMGKKVPVNVSNGEYEMPPEQVHAVGAQVLDQMKSATHAPAKGFKPDPDQPEEVFFANGGVVEDEPHREKMRRALQRGPFGGPARAPGASGDKSPHAESGAGFKKAVTAGDFTSPQAAGATVRASAKQGVDWINRGANALADAAVAPNKALYGAVAEDFKGGFMKGLFSGSPGEPAANPEPRAVTAQTPGGNPEAGAATDNLMVNPGQRQAIDMPRRGAVNNDPIAAGFLKNNSAPRSDTLNVRNTQDIPGLEGTGYAGRYGDTDVFAGEGQQGEASFSDLSNLATTRGGAAAPLPQGDEPGAGNPVAGQDGGRGFNLAAANEEWRKANAIRQEQLDERRDRGFQDAARRADPAGTYAAELSQQGVNEQMQAEIARTLQEQMQEQEKTNYSRGQDFIENRRRAMEAVMETLAGGDSLGVDPYQQQVATALFRGMDDVVDPSVILGATQEAMAGLGDTQDPAQRPPPQALVAEYLQSRQGGNQAPQAGQVVDGYRFTGGNPADPENWEAAE